MIIKILKERRKKAEKLDRLKRLVEGNLIQLNNDIKEYDSLHPDDVKRLEMNKYINDIVSERRIFNYILSLIEED